MKRIAFAALVVAAACAKRPPYVPPAPIATSQRVGVTRRADSAHVFFDSLAAERRRDSVRLIGTPLVRPISAETIASVAWMDIIRDSALTRLVETALRQNRTLQSAAARINEYRALVGVARAPLRPSVTINGSQAVGQTVVGSLPPASYHTTRITGDLAWELDFWGRQQYGVDAATAELGAQTAAERATVLSLVSDIATSYVQLLELDQERAIAERTLSSRRSTLELARARYAQGVTSELDVRQFEAQVAAPAVTIAQIDRAMALAEHNLDVLVGQTPAPIARGASLADAVRTLSIPDSIPAALLARRPDIEQAERGYAAATARAGIADASRKPTISIGGTLGSNARSPDRLLGADSRVYQGLIGISFPVFDNGRLASASAAARARVEQARAFYEGVALNALREAGDALAVVRASQELTVAQATQANALRLALELAQLRYQAGLATYLEVLDAQRSLFTAELALSQSQMAELLSAVQLYKALGGSWPGR